ncbi:MAG: hypothetical protein IJ841_02150 [Prevotella sp.]|nr:hypothetical protein [Prevotella sp.]
MKRLFLYACLGLMAFTACTTEGDGDEDLKQNMPLAGSENDTWAADGSNGWYGGEFEGVWMVDGQSVEDTAMPAYPGMRVWISGRTLVCAYFPYKAILGRLYPTLTNFSVYSIETETPLNSLPANVAEMAAIVQNHRDSSANFYERIPLSPVGISASTAYYEVAPVEGYAYRYHPFVVSCPDGNCFATVLCVVPDRSTVSVNMRGGALSLVLTVARAETLDSLGKATTKVLGPEMKLMFTSTRRTR